MIPTTVRLYHVKLLMSHLRLHLTSCLFDLSSQVGHFINHKHVSNHYRVLELGCSSTRVYVL